ncbi:MAG: glutamyl-tRNA reductase [Lachnospiraceae bacterium]|nr:glutamyl-tRNA reductase [Lachnospiraceae bacterium]
MYCISVSFQKTPIGIREKFAFHEEEQGNFLRKLQEQGSISGGVVVSTCNRSELYFTGEGNPTESVEHALAEWKQMELGYVRKYCLYYTDRKAVRHLFKVACGLDSMVLGEDEILHQVKEAYLLAKNQGHSNSELNMIFQGAFHCAKLSKSGTRLSNTPLSVGTLAANVIEEYLRTCEADVEEAHRVLVIGATGKIGSIVAKDLMAKGISVLGTKRSHHSPDGIYCCEHMEWVDFQKRYDYISEVDAIVSATTSPHYTLTVEEYQKRVGKHRKQLLIDLAVPYDIDKEIGKQSSVSLLDIDYFKTRSMENTNIRFGEMEKVRQIVEECAEETLKKLYLREFREKLKARYEEEWFRKMTWYLKEVLDSEQFLQVLKKIQDTEISSRGKGEE